MSKGILFSIIAIALSLSLNACSTTKGPAEAAIKAADEAIAGVRADASAYLPDQLKTIEDALAAAKENFQKGAYDQALTGAKDLAGQAKDLASAVAAKKEELTRSWQEMSGGVPGMVEQIQSRMNILSKSRRLPAGIDKNRFESAKDDLANVLQTWSDAASAYDKGDLMNAVSKAGTVKDKAVEIMGVLGMTPPAAAVR